MNENMLFPSRKSRHEENQLNAFCSFLYKQHIKFANITNLFDEIKFSKAFFEGFFSDVRFEPRLLRFVTRPRTWYTKADRYWESTKFAICTYLVNDF